MARKDQAVQVPRSVGLRGAERVLRVVFDWLGIRTNATARAGISDQRMQEKLGWVEHYEDDIGVWQECQDVVSVSLTFINEQQLRDGERLPMSTEILESVFGLYKQ